MDVSPRIQAGGSERPAGGSPERGLTALQGTSSGGKEDPFSLPPTGPETGSWWKAGGESEGMSNKEKFAGFKEQCLVWAGLQLSVDGLVGGFTSLHSFLPSAGYAGPSLSFELKADDKRRVPSLLRGSLGFNWQTQRRSINAPLRCQDLSKLGALSPEQPARSLLQKRPGVRSSSAGQQSGNIT